MERDLDIVVFGATGDTGVVASCILFYKGRKLGLRSWAPAARNLGKLKSDLLDRLPNTAPGEEGLTPSAPIQADSGDHDSLVKMCARAKCVVACAGPYEQYGEGVVRACVEAGTDYIDVTGEVPWVQRMERKYGEEAERRGVTLVSMAGYDSVPPDLTTYLAAKALQRGGESMQRCEVFAGGGGGAMPTGTINTMCGAIAAGKSWLLGIATFGLAGEKRKSPPADGSSPLIPKSGKKYVPDTEASNLSRNSLWTMCPGYSSLAGHFCLPHFMAPINIKVVHRTAASEGYGGLEYRERMGGLPSGLLSLYGLVPTCMGVAGAMVLGLLVALPYSTSAILKLRDTMNPPLQQQVRRLMFEGFKSTGKTTADALAISHSGRTTVKVEMRSAYDPGLGFTMLSACTVAGAILRKARTSEKARSGFHTAVTAVGGEALADALKEMGVQIEVSTQTSSRL